MDNLKKSLLASTLNTQRTAILQQTAIVSALLTAFPLPNESKNAKLVALVDKLMQIATRFAKHSNDRLYSEAATLIQNGVFNETGAKLKLSATAAMVGRQMGTLEMTLVPEWKNQVIDPSVEIVRRDYDHLPQPDKSVTFEAHGFLHYQGEVLLNMLQSFTYLMYAVQRLDLDDIRESTEAASAQ